MEEDEIDKSLKEDNASASDNIKEVYKDFFKIKDEIMEQLKIDDLNIGEKALKLPRMKQYWIAKMIQCKIELNELEERKKQMYQELLNSPQVTEVALSEKSLLKRFNGSAKVKAITQRMQVLSTIVEYLNDAKFAFGRVTDDIKNKIELEKLERL